MTGSTASCFPQVRAFSRLWHFQRFESDSILQGDTPLPVAERPLYTGAIVPRGQRHPERHEDSTKGTEAAAKGGGGEAWGLPPVTAAEDVHGADGRALGYFGAPHSAPNLVQEFPNVLSRFQPKSAPES